MIFDPNHYRAIPMTTPAVYSVGPNQEVFMSTQQTAAKPAPPRKETIEVPIAKTHKTAVAITLDRDAEQSWTWAARIQMVGFSSLGVSLTSNAGASWDSRSEALEDALEATIAWFADHHAKNSSVSSFRKRFDAGRASLQKLLDKTRAGMNSGRGGRLAHPATTSTTTPAGIAAIDRSAAKAAPASQAAFAEIPIHLVAPSPWQPREAPAEEVDALVESVRDWGVKQPIVVRRKLGGDPLFPYSTAPVAEYELCAGERRLRAAAAAGLETIPAMVQTWTDQEAHAFAVVENLQRQDLSTWEKAAAMRGLFAAGRTQQEIGRLVGMTQGSVSLLLSCLELPREWIDGSIAREMTPTHARALLPYKHVPEVLEELKRQLAQEQEWGEPFPSAKAMPEYVEQAAKEATAPMEGTVPGGHRFDWNRVSIFDCTEQDREQLGIVRLPLGKGGKMELRATNRERWKQLQEAHEKELLKAKTNGKQGAQAKGQKTKLTPAQEKQKAKERAAQTAKQWAAFRAQWLRYLCWQTLQTPAKKDAHRPAINRILLLAAALDVERGDVAAALLDAGASKPKQPTWPDQRIPQLTAEQVAASHATLARRLLWDATEGAGVKGRYPRDYIVSAAAAEVIAQELTIDRAAWWNREQAGPLTGTFYRLASRQQLCELAEQWGFGGIVKPSATKGQLVQILSSKKFTALPEWLR